jgi:hypothetical protein
VPTRTPTKATVSTTAGLTIRSTPPNSLILIDGESLGVTGEDGLLNLPTFKPGVYTVSVSKVGYQSASKEITLLAGRKESLTFDLAIGTQTLSIISSPPECEVYVDDVRRGSTDASGKASLTDLAIGDHKVTLRKERYRDANIPFSLSADKAGQINTNLELAVGFLTVKTNVPNASIDISGMGQFENPVDKIECKPGTYIVTISSPQYTTSRRDVIVAAGQKAELSVDLVADAEVRSESKIDPGGSNPVTETIPAVASPRSNYVVPNGVFISGILESEIDTKNSQNNDRFRMTVQSPDEFRGAIIEGYISGVRRSGKVTGRASVTFNFEKITLRKGQTYDFAGNLQSIRDQTGKNVTVDNEGTAKGNSQTKQTAKRAGIGAILGGVVGGVVGGAAGAAAGAAIGGGAGAASSAVHNEDIKLKKGSTISLQSSSPLRQ